MKTTATLIASGLLITGCATEKPVPKKSAGPANTTIVAPATKEQAAALDQIKSLAGTWEKKGEDGKMEVATVFAVSSSGSVVREVMLPGAPHEMTNIYHMDGPTLVMTHYCAMGNQPVLHATSAKKGEIAFQLDHVLNMTSADQPYMGQLTLVIKDKDHLVEHWRGLKNGKANDEAVFELTRAK